MARHVAGRSGAARLEDGGPVGVAESYMVGAARVSITLDGRYIVSEPPLSAGAAAAWRRLMEGLRYSYSDPADGDAVAEVRRMLEEEAAQTGLLGQYSRERGAIEYYLLRDIAGYRELDVMMNDPGIEDVICTGPGRRVAVIHRNHPGQEMLESNVSFPTAESLDGLIQVIMQRHGRAPTTSKPIAYCSTPANDRITVTWGAEVSRPGSTIAVRRFPSEPHTITHLLESGFMSPLMAAYVWLMNDARSFSFIVGETGSGKTTAVNALACLSNPRWHVLTIEEVRELTIPHYWNEYLVTRTSPHLSESAYDVGIMGLGMAALRKKPHYVIVGEVRGAEVRQLFQVALTGHGCVSTVHAPGPADLLARLGGDEMGVSETQQSCISYVLHVRRARTGGSVARRAVSLTEVVPDGRARPVLRELFSHDGASDAFSCGSAAEMAGRSAWAGRAAGLLGIGDVEADIARRMGLLNECVSRGARRVGQVFGIVSRYYDVAVPGRA